MHFKNIGGGWLIHKMRCQCKDISNGRKNQLQQFTCPDTMFPAIHFFTLTGHSPKTNRV